MSFHGGFIGVLVAMWLFACKHKVKFWAVADFVAPLIPLGFNLIFSVEVNHQKVCKRLFYLEFF